MGKTMWALDHTTQCRMGGPCDCPTFGETLAEEAQAIIDAADGPLPPWLGENDRPTLVAEANRRLADTQARFAANPCKCGRCEDCLRAQEDAEERESWEEYETGERHAA